MFSRFFFLIPFLFASLSTSAIYFPFKINKFIYNFYFSTFNGKVENIQIKVFCENHFKCCAIINFYVGNLKLSMYLSLKPATVSKLRDKNSVTVTRKFAAAFRRSHIIQCHSCCKQSFLTIGN